MQRRECMKRLVSTIITGLIVLSIFLTLGSEVKASMEEDTIPIEHHISGVPFVRQETMWCGPASLTMVLNYWGDQVSQYEVGSVVDPVHDGTKPLHMIPYLESRGYVVYDFDRDSLEYRISVLDELKIWVCHDYPIVVRQWSDLSKKSGHYRVVVGYDAEKIYVIDPKHGSKAFGIEYFLQLWARNYEYGLLVIGDPTKDSDGDHTTDSNEVIMNTDPFVDSFPPNISIVSPKNRIYVEADIPLAFIIDETVVCMTYSLDNNANVTIAGNQSLSGLSDESHSLIVYAKDAAGNIGTSEIIHFTIETQQPEPFPVWIVAAIVIIAVSGVALLIYFTKVKKKTKKSHITEL